MSASSQKTILVVDDELEIAHAVKSVLEDEGYKILIAADGAEALTSLAQAKPDLILMDVMMPRLSGYEVLKKLHEDNELKNRPVILMSCVNPHVKQSDFKWQHFLKKPFSIEDLTNAVKHLLG
jgi:CheY-like chemotaxis protein